MLNIGKGIKTMDNVLFLFLFLLELELTRKKDLFNSISGKVWIKIIGVNSIKDNVLPGRKYSDRNMQV